MKHNGIDVDIVYRLTKENFIWHEGKFYPNLLTV